MKSAPTKNHRLTKEEFIATLTESLIEQQTTIEQLTEELGEMKQVPEPSFFEKLGSIMRTHADDQDIDNPVIAYEQAQDRKAELEDKIQSELLLLQRTQEQLHKLETPAKAKKQTVIKKYIEPQKPKLPKIILTGFSRITFDQFLTESTSKDIEQVNDRGQNLVHYFVSDPTRWNPGYFLALMTGTDMSKEQKDQLATMASTGDNLGMTPAHYAAIYGDIQWLKEFSEYTDLLRADTNGKSTIDYILDHLDPELLSEFIEVCLDNDVNIDLGKGKTLAHCIATHHNSAELFKMLSLSRHGCQMDTQDKHGNTPLMLAAGSGKLENIAAVLEATAEQTRQTIKANRIHQVLDRMSGKKASPTKKLSQEELEEELKNEEKTAIEAAQRKLLNMTNTEGKNVLHMLVAANPDIDAAYLSGLAKLMAIRGENISAKDMLGDNIAHVAARAGNLDLLINLASDPAKRVLLTTPNGMQQTPIHILLQKPRSKREDQQTSAKMIKLGESIPAIASIPTDNHGNNLLHYAAGGNHHEIIGWLLPHKSLVLNWENNEGQTPIHLAARNAHNEALERLFIANIGIDVNAQDKDGNTALHFAATNGDLKNITLLAKAGADPYISNNKGETVFDLLDKTEKKTRTPDEEQRRVQAYASLILHKDLKDLTKKPQKMEAEKALHEIAKDFTQKLYKVLLQEDLNLDQLTNKTGSITKDVLKDIRPLNGRENMAFSKELKKKLRPILDDMLELHKAKNYQSKKPIWNLVGRLIDCISNALIVAKYIILGLGKPEERLFKQARTAVQDKLKEIPTKFALQNPGKHLAKELEKRKKHDTDKTGKAY